MASNSPEKKDPAPFDVVLVHGKTADGGGACVLRARPGRLEAGEVRPLRHGKPIRSGAQVVTLTQRPEVPNLYDVNTHYGGDQEETPKVDAQTDAESPGAQTDRNPSDGPPQIATRAYRESWERTFGSQRRTRRLAN